MKCYHRLRRKGCFFNKINFLLSRRRCKHTILWEDRDYSKDFIKLSVLDRIYFRERRNKELGKLIISIGRKLHGRHHSMAAFRSWWINRLLQEGEVEEALEELMKLAEHYLKEQNYREAYSICRRILMRDPDHRGARSIIGNW